MKVFASNFIIIVIPIYLFELHWIFTAAHGLSLVVVRGATLSRGFSCCGTWALSSWT